MVKRQDRTENWFYLVTHLQYDLVGVPEPSWAQVSDSVMML